MPQGGASLLLAHLHDPAVLPGGRDHQVALAY